MTQYSHKATLISIYLLTMLYWVLTKGVYMNLGDILKTVGSGLIQTLLPGTGSVIVAGINHFLDDDNQLPENAINSLLIHYHLNNEQVY